LILDTLRARNVSSYGYPILTTPHLDAFARQSLLFRRAFSAATWTVPSHASLLSGLYISQHRIESINGNRRFNAEIVTLPEALRSHGYRTAAFSQNLLFSPQNHLDQGFDEFYSVEELLSSHRMTRLIQRLSGDSPRQVRLVARYLRKMIAPRLLLDNMLAWIKTWDRKTPFFLFANVLSPHFPWTLPPGFLPHGEGFKLKYLLNYDFLTLKKQWEFNSGKRQVTDAHRRVWHTLYDAAIRHVDSEIGRFIERLRQSPGWEETIFIVTSDHGEMMGDYRGIVGHVLSLHDNLIHVPLIIRHPDYLPGLTVEGVVQTLDLYPSLLEWARVPAEGVPSPQLQRPPLSKAISAANDPSGYAFAEEDYTDSYDIIGKLLQVNPAADPNQYPRQQIAVRSASHKYIWYNDRPGELFDIGSDPLEEHNLIDGGNSTVQPVVHELQGALETWRANLKLFPPQQVDGNGVIDPVMLEHLRALGYMP
jgi:arylsulfatase A-like enzyme